MKTANHTSISKNSELNVFKKLKYFSEIPNN